MCTDYNKNSSNTEHAVPGLGTSMNMGIPTPTQLPTTVASRLAPVDERNKPKFSFRFDWNSMPKTAIDNLSTAEASEVPGCANVKDVDELRTALRTQCIQQYIAYREMYPGQQLTPGKKVYEEMTNEVKSTLCLNLLTGFKRTVKQILHL